MEFWVDGRCAKELARCVSRERNWTGMYYYLDSGCGYLSRNRSQTDHRLFGPEA